MNDNEKLSRKIDKTIGAIENEMISMTAELNKLRKIYVVYNNHYAEPFDSIIGFEHSDAILITRRVMNVPEDALVTVNGKPPIDSAKLEFGDIIIFTDKRK